MTPFKPSWIDRHFDWIDRLPIPTWFYYVILFILTATLSNIPFWIDGFQPGGSLLTVNAVSGLWLLVQQSATHILLRSAKGALESFRPAMNVQKKEYERLLFEIQTLPSRPVLLFNFLVAAGIIYLAMFAPQGLGNQIQSPAALGVSAIGVFTGFLFAPILMYAALRQMRLVSYAYTRATKINLFKLQPLYALSTLTAKAGIALFLLVPLNYLQNVILRPDGLGPGFVIVMTIFGVGLATSAFLVPLWAIHIRIAERKEEVFAENGDRLGQTSERLGKRVDKNDLADAPVLEKAISALLKLRTEIEKTSTWPWEQSTLRGFLSAIMLPIFLFVVQQLLVRFL